MKNISDYINRLFESREQSHIYHLQSEKYSSHMALQVFYESIGEKIDDLVESYQGQYDIISDYTYIKDRDIDRTDVLNYFEDLVSFVKNSRYEYIKKDDIHLQSIIDDIIILTYKTIYKLKILK